MHRLNLLAVVAVLLIADSSRAQPPAWQQNGNGARCSSCPGCPSAGGKHPHKACFLKTWCAECEMLCCMSCGMVQHLDYTLPGDRSYYFRPYNALTLEQQREISAGWGGDYRNPYDNRMFEELYRSTNDQRSEPILPGLGAAHADRAPATAMAIKPASTPSNLAAANRPATTATPKVVAGQKIVRVTWQAAPEAKERKPAAANPEPAKSAGSSSPSAADCGSGQSGSIFFSDRDLRRE